MEGKTFGRVRNTLRKAAVPAHDTLVWHHSLAPVNPKGRLIQFEWPSPPPL